MPRCPYCKRRFDSQDAVNGHLSHCPVRNADSRSGRMQGFAATYYREVTKHFQREDIPAMVIGAILGAQAIHYPWMYPQLAALILPLVTGAKGLQNAGRLQWAAKYLSVDRLPAFMLFFAVAWLSVWAAHRGILPHEIWHWVAGRSPGHSH